MMSNAGVNGASVNGAPHRRPGGRPSVAVGRKAGRVKIDFGVDPGRNAGRIDLAPEAALQLARLIEWHARQVQQTEMKPCDRNPC